MTNTRLTDPEVLEFRYPVLLEDFHIRKGSGGRGQWNAGDGIRRTIRFLEQMDCTILSGHRRVRPFGLAGGEAGQVGENWVRRNDGRMERLKGARRHRARRRRGGHHPDADRRRLRQAARRMIDGITRLPRGWVAARFRRDAGERSRRAASEPADESSGSAEEFLLLPRYAPRRRRSHGDIARRSAPQPPRRDD